ncbi:MAG TPA: hypothetical protein VFH52_00370 [Rhodanobacteraceae bacterium]|nr:hypothetical protein [Rhodanobacteraceae bacterium]
MAPAPPLPLLAVLPALSLVLGFQTIASPPVPLPAPPSGLRPGRPPTPPAAPHPDESAGVQVWLHAGTLTHVNANAAIARASGCRRGVRDADGPEDEPCACASSDTTCNMPNARFQTRL